MRIRIVIACISVWAAACPALVWPDPGDPDVDACAARHGDDGRLMPLDADCETSVWCTVSAPMQVDQLEIAGGELLVAAGQRGLEPAVMRFDGCVWTDFSTEAVMVHARVMRLDGLGRVWLGGGNSVQRLDPRRVTTRTWTVPEPLRGDVTGLWIGPDGEAWMTTGDGGVAVLRDEVWRPIGLPAGVGLRAVDGKSRTDLFFVGNAGTLYRRRSDAVTPREPFTTEDLAAVHFVAGDTVWMAGSHGALFWFHDGFRSDVRWGSQVSLRAITGKHVDDVWIAGGNTVLHWNGSAIAEQQVPDVRDASDLVVDDAGNVWVAGETQELRIWRKRDM